MHVGSVYSVSSETVSTTLDGSVGGSRSAPLFDSHFGLAPCPGRALDSKSVFLFHWGIREAQTYVVIGANSEPETGNL